MDQDQYLLKKLKHDDDYSAFETIFNKYYDPLKTWSLYVLGNNTLAEEAVMDVFMKLWNTRKKIHINISLRSYLFTAVKNQSIDYLRRDLKKSVPASSAEIKSDVLQPDEWMDLMELQNKIEEAIDDLPEQCRNIFRMSRDDGMKYKEIAKKLNISVKTVETQIGRALIKLKKTIYNQ
jgi:RNA polymerase sigma-70 factor (ECF subfamily)